jgi:hypothetical protein
MTKMQSNNGWRSKRRNVLGASDAFRKERDALRVELAIMQAALAAADKDLISARARHPA